MFFFFWNSVRVGYELLVGLTHLCIVYRIKRARTATPKMEVTHTIWYLDLNDDYVEWTRFGLTLPYKMDPLDYEAVVAYDYLVFIFYHTKSEVWCLDLKHDNLEKVPKECEVRLGQFSQMIVTEDNVIHSICLDSFGPIHLKIDAEQLIPEEIFENFSKECADLICGYIKENCRYTIPEAKTMYFELSCFWMESL